MSDIFSQFEEYERSPEGQRDKMWMEKMAARKAERSRKAKTRRDVKIVQQAALRVSHDRLLKALEGVVAIADRKTVEFDEARAAIAAAGKVELR